jgi:hypothetical protein
MGGCGIEESAEHQQKYNQAGAHALVLVRQQMSGKVASLFVEIVRKLPNPLLKGSFRRFKSQLEGYFRMRQRNRVTTAKSVSSSEAALNTMRSEAPRLLPAVRGR